MTVRRKILFVAMHNSPHTARWIDIATDLGYDLHIFPLEPSTPHHKLRDLTLHVPVLDEPPKEAVKEARRKGIRSRVLNFLRLLRSDPAYALNRIKQAMLMSPTAEVIDVEPPPFDTTSSGVKIRHLSTFQTIGAIADVTETVRLGRDDESNQTTLRIHGPDVLASLISKLKPDLIHSMEFQHSAYLVLAARDRIKGPFPRWLATNWGSDIFLFGRQPDHARQIRRVCEAIDLYSCECHRDLALGREFGYRGPDLPVLPNSGGMDINHVLSLRDPEPPSRRKLIMVKGYDHFAGRAMVSLAVLERFAEQLKDHTIVLFSVSAKPRVRALELAEAGILNIKVIDWATHDDILRHFGQARIYLGISISDAISTSVLEAMVMGAFPIQTNTSCCEEWFVHEKTGFAIPPDDFEKICERFATALTDDNLVDAAAIENFEIIKSRLAVEVLRPKMDEFYRRAFAQ
ncbi:MULTISPECIES: glycosyltransferase [unclassified Bradyrhizobium]|uniref:glycosyltransferase n=1 Tax=unclassified Bradyrhizobium TaxID=2631580 RepID=UPI001CD66727|nr:MULTISPECIES: glycosyltransferase [unclassified Bradyrhizobium]MCA1378979.1 glycosyltransferase [Bradyrhizobium sp. IC4060]MCA1488549.1 glycosyltransferase [Bradyrhizobium sp. IC4061]